MRLLITFIVAVPLLGGVFPQPREMRSTGESFALDQRVIIAVPFKPTNSDKKLATLLAAEMADRHGLGIQIKQIAQITPADRAIVMGVATNPLVGSVRQKRDLPGPEGYILEISRNRIVVAGTDERGAFYGMQSLRQLISNGSVPGMVIRDWPDKPLRGIKLYLPGRNNIPFFKRFVRDFMALYKYNTVIIELNAAMRLDRRPELNAGWQDFARDLNFSRRDRSLGNNLESQDSSHQDTGDGGVLEKSEVADLVKWANDHYINVIPEVPTLTHSYYLLTRHRELAENADVEWPDTYCPSNPHVYPLVFDVIDEYVEVMKPAMMHVGHDEWRVPWGRCRRCADRDFRELYIENLTRIHKHLAAKNVKTAIWGDHLIEPLRGVGLAPRTTKTGLKYVVPGALTPEQVEKSIPKDILIFNWFWDERYAETGQGKKNDRALDDWRFQWVFGNMTTSVQDYETRAESRGLIGGAPSSWAATTEFNFGKDLLHSFMGCANMLWARKQLEPAQLAQAIEEHTPSIRRYWSGFLPPSDFDPVVPIELPEHGSAAIPALRRGRVQAGTMFFNVDRPAVARTGGESVSVPVGEDVTSLIFLHAAEKPGVSYPGHRWIYNFEDVTDLLGWYEIVYEDGLVMTIPLRYKYNILDWNRMRKGGESATAYGADAVSVGADATSPVTFYALEWQNARFGKVIREVRLRTPTEFRRGDAVAPPNAVILGAVSIVKKRGFPDPGRATSYEE